MSRPLRGVRVLDLTRLLPGPFATLLLADLGAEITKIEDPGLGDYARHYPPMAGGMSAAFAALNRDKRGVALNLKKPGGPEVLHRLAERADVLIESFRPGVMDRLGVGAQALTARNPALIYCAISGYGQTGPLAQRAGHDLNYVATTGLLSLADGQPAFQLADLAGGALYPVIGILAALYERRSTGKGRVVDASMTDGAAGFGVMFQAGQFLSGEVPRELCGDRLCYRTWRCKDGGRLAAGPLEPKFWMGFCAAIGRPDLLGDAFARGARAAVVDDELAALFATKTRDEWAALFAAHDVCVEPVLSLKEARETPHAKARGLFGVQRHPSAGDRDVLVVYPNPALLPGAEPPATSRPAPLLGEHTAGVLREVGYDDEAIDRLAAAGVIRP